MKFLSIMIVSLSTILLLTGCGGSSNAALDSSGTSVGGWKQHYSLTYFQDPSLNYIEVNAGITLGADSNYNDQNINLTSPANLTANSVAMT